MTAEELWSLFPIILKEHNPQYKCWFEEEKQSILNVVNRNEIVRINHIGSSAVAGLVSKPTIDILVEIDGCCDVTTLIKTLNESGWGIMQQESDPMKIKFCKGYTSDGFSEKVYHLHVGYYGDWSELYFRDYLIDNPNVAAEYGKIKLSLFEKLEHDRDAYTKAKSEFVVKCSNAAKQEYHNRYKPR